MQAPHNTCGSCWLGTAQQFYHDMRRLITRIEARGTHKPIHGLAITSRMHTAISLGHPWTAVFPLRVFLYFGGPRGPVQCPKAMKTNGTKRSDKKKKQKNQGNLQGKKTAKMGGGTSIRSQPANFARESNPASLLIKIL